MTTHNNPQTTQTIHNRAHVTISTFNQLVKFHYGPQLLRQTLFCTRAGTSQPVSHHVGTRAVINTIRTNSNYALVSALWWANQHHLTSTTLSAAPKCRAQSAIYGSPVHSPWPPYIGAYRNDIQVIRPFTRNPWGLPFLSKYPLSNLYLSIAPNPDPSYLRYPNHKVSRHNHFKRTPPILLETYSYAINLNLSIHSLKTASSPHTSVILISHSFYSNSHLLDKVAHLS